MNQMTFIEKVQVLFKLMFSSPVIIGIFAFSMILMIVLFFYSKFNKKIIKYVFSLIYISLIGFAVVKYGKYFLVGIDSFLTLFMANIYFPVIPVYVVMMLISFIIMIFTLNSKKKSRIVKIINTVFFTIIQMLFALFIYIVESNNIDLSSNNGLYSNEQTMTLLELGMGIFVVWIILLLIILYLKKADKIFKVKHDDVTDDFDEYINDYNEPKNISTVNNEFVDEINNVSADISSVSYYSPSSNDIVKNLVPETNNYVNNVSIDYSSANNDKIVSNNNVNNNSISGVNNSNVSDVFGNFNFLNVQNDIERKEEDVEIIDFD